MSHIQTDHLFDITLAVEAPLQLIGHAPFGDRRIAKVTGGSFEGPNIKGTVRGGGGDWILVRNDGVMQLDVRLVLETDDGALIYMTYTGLRHGPDDVMARLNDGQPVNRNDYYFRIVPSFETSAEKYLWLNKVICIGSGDRTPTGPVYNVYRVL